MPPETHDSREIQVDGFWHSTCRCGWRSEPFGKWEEARASWEHNHYGFIRADRELKERIAKRDFEQVRDRERQMIAARFEEIKARFAKKK